MRKCVIAEIRYVAWENMCMCICVHAVCVYACDICVCMCMRYAHVICHMKCSCLSMLLWHMHMFFGMHLATEFVTSFVLHKRMYRYARNATHGQTKNSHTDRVYEGIAS